MPFDERDTLLPVELTEQLDALSVEAFYDIMAIRRRVNELLQRFVGLTIHSCDLVRERVELRIATEKGVTEPIKFQKPAMTGW